MSIRFKLQVIAAVMAMNWVTLGWAQEVPVPPDVQIPLLLKVISYDHDLVTKGADRLVVGILFQRHYKPSVDAKNTILHLVEDGSLRHLDGIPLEFLPIDISEEPAWPTTLGYLDPDILYVAPLRGVAVQSIATITRAHSIATITGVPEYVDRGLAVGVAGIAEKPQILVNLSAAKAEGLNIGSQALKLARLVGGEGKGH